MTIELGEKVKDRITGFEGIAISRVEYLNGCVQYCVKPFKYSTREGKMLEGEYIDEGQLVNIGNGEVMDVGQRKRGGVMPDTPSTTYSG